MQKQFTTALTLVVMTIFLGVSSSCAQAPAKFTLTKEGVGPIKNGMSATKIPAKVEGLYDRFEAQFSDFEEITYYNFYAGDMIVMNATDNNDKKVSEITIFSPEISTAEGFHPGMLLSKIISQPGVEFYYQPGYWMSYKGYHFEFDFNGLTAAGQKKGEAAYNKGTDLVFKAADFAPTTKITSIRHR